MDSVSVGLSHSSNKLLSTKSDCKDLTVTQHLHNCKRLTEQHVKDAPDKSTKTL